jgi:hypothetical protein
MVPAMRRLVLLSLAFASLLSLSTAVIACGGDDDDDGTAIDAAAGDPADAAADPADAASTEADAGVDAGGPHGFAPR